MDTCYTEAIPPAPLICEYHMRPRHRRAHITVVGEVAAGPVHVADGAEQDIGQRLVQRLGAVQQLMRHCEEQPALAPKAQGQTCTRACSSVKEISNT